MRLLVSVCCALACVCSVPAAFAQPFSYEPPGQLEAPNTAGVSSNTVWVPGMRFPIENAPAYPNSQVYGVGGSKGPPGGQCAAVNYNYPWHDNYCEPRIWSMPLCPAGTGHQGQDIRPATCQDSVHWCVAAEAGQITNIGSYSVYLTTPSGVLHRYLHMKMSGLPVSVGQTVAKGQKLGLVSDTFYDSSGNSVPTSIHLHYDIRMFLSQTGVNTYVPPYTSLIESYQDLIVPPEPCASIPAAGGTVDELSTCFEKFGPPQFWRTESGIGIDNHIFWTNAFDGAAPSNWAKWTLDTEVSGQYELEVHVQSPFNLSTATPYRVRHGGVETDVTLDQSSSSGWRSLGIYDFATGPDQWVAVYDNSGETGSALHITADAVRLTPYVPPVAEPEPPPPVDEGPPPPVDEGPPPVEDTWVPPLPDAGPSSESDNGSPVSLDTGAEPDAGTEPMDVWSPMEDVKSDLDTGVLDPDTGAGPDTPSVEPVCLPLGPVGGLIDNLDPCFMADQAFELNDGSGMGGAHVASGTGATIPGTATWTVRSSLSGTFDIEAYIPDESTGVVTYRILGNDFLVDTDALAGWRVLGTFELEPGVDVQVELSTADISPDQLVFADAIWVRPSVPVAADCEIALGGGVVDDTEPCFSATEGWVKTSGYGFGGAVHVSSSAADGGARYVFSVGGSAAEDPRDYDLQVRSVVELNRSKQVEFRWESGSDAGFVNAEQAFHIIDLRDVDGWTTVGRVRLPLGGQHTLIVTNLESQTVATDAIRLIPASGITPAVPSDKVGEPASEPLPAASSNGLPEDGGCLISAHSQPSSIPLGCAAMLLFVLWSIRRRSAGT